MRWLRRFNQPDPDRLTLIQPTGAPVEVVLRRRAAARRITLRVSSITGDVTLTLPERTSLASARSFLDAHAGWVAARLGRRPDRVPLDAGHVVPLRGVPHTILRGDVTRAPVRLTAEEGEPAIVVSGDEAGLPGRLRRYLQGEAKRDLTAAVACYAERLEVRPGRITVRDTRSRWGSCSASGALSFSWRLILAPPMVLDYLAAHEVAHLREMNHSARFWRLLRDACPATDAAEGWLKQHGSALHRYG